LGKEGVELVKVILDTIPAAVFAEQFRLACPGGIEAEVAQGRGEPAFALVLAQLLLQARQ